MEDPWLMLDYVPLTYPTKNRWERPKRISIIDEDGITVVRKLTADEKREIEQMNQSEREFILANGCKLNFDIKCLDGTQTSPEPYKRELWQRRPSWQIGPGRLRPDLPAFGWFVSMADLLWRCCERETPLSHEVLKLLELREDPYLFEVDWDPNGLVCLDSVFTHNRYKVLVLDYDWNQCGLEVKLPFCDSTGTCWGTCYKIFIPDSVLEHIAPSLFVKIKNAKLKEQKVDIATPIKDTPLKDIMGAVMPTDSCTTGDNFPAVFEQFMNILSDNVPAAVERKHVMGQRADNTGRTVLIGDYVLVGGNTLLDVDRDGIDVSESLKRQGIVRKVTGLNNPLDGRLSKTAKLKLACEDPDPKIAQEARERLARRKAYKKELQRKKRGKIRFSPFY